MQERRVQSLGQEDPLEKEMAIHTSILAWDIPWAEESGRLHYMGLQRVGYNLVTKQQQQTGLNHNIFLIENIPCRKYSISLMVQWLRLHPSTTGG